MTLKRPTMFMIAGPNGAGKSTLYDQVIAPRVTAPFINADLIQRDELRDPNMEAAYKAAQIAEQRRLEHLAQGKSFVAESTFSHESKLALIHQAKAAGFRVVLYHVNLRNPELSIDRVAQRVEHGGHDVPADKIRERFQRNAPLIREAVRLADRAFVYDNSIRGQPPGLQMKFEHGLVTGASDRMTGWARELYAQDLKGFSAARLNPAAASFAEAKQIARDLGGEASRLSVAKTGQRSSYRGAIVGETALHWVQEIGPRSYAAHFKAMLPELAMHQSYTLTYDGRGQANAKPSGRAGLVR